MFLSYHFCRTPPTFLFPWALPSLAMSEVLPAPEQAEPVDVYISHSIMDTDVAKQLLLILSRLQLTCYMDEEPDIQADSVATRALHGAKSMLVIASKDFFDTTLSYRPQTELATVLARQTEEKSQIIWPFFYKMHVKDCGSEPLQKQLADQASSIPGGPSHFDRKQHNLATIFSKDLVPGLLHHLGHPMPSAQDLKELVGSAFHSQGSNRPSVLALSPLSAAGTSASVSPSVDIVDFTGLDSNNDGSGGASTNAPDSDKSQHPLAYEVKDTNPLRELLQHSTSDDPADLVKSVVRIMVIGLQRTGKSSLIHRFFEQEAPDEEYDATVGASYHNHNFYTKDTQLEVQVWDLAGQQKYWGMAPMYSRTCNAVILVLDAQNPQAVEDTQDILHDPNIKLMEVECPVLVALNKVDAPHQSLDEEYGRNAFLADATDLASKFESKLIHVSARTGLNVDALFHQALAMALGRVVFDLTSDFSRMDFVEDVPCINALLPLFIPSRLPRGLRRLNVARWSGVMDKRGTFNRAWKKRFFRLQGTKLAYYADESRAKAKGEIELSHCQLALGGVSLQPTDKDFKERERILLITTPARTYRLRAVSELAATTTISVLRLVLRLHKMQLV